LEPTSAISERKRPTITFVDVIMVLILLLLALLPPIAEVHKQLILAAIAALQFLEGRLVAWLPKRGPAYTVLLKILLATLLLYHTGDVGINSIYYPIFFLPVITAATYFGPIATLAWTALASLGYCSLLIPVWQDYDLGPEGEAILAIRILFFFLAAVLVNRLVMENRRQVAQYQKLSETLEETNRQLRRAEDEARRSERLAALGQLSAGLAHEIRNPLGVIKGSAEMLTKKLQASQPLESELAGYISSEVNRLNALVARFLDFARPQRVEFGPVRISALVDHCLESVQAQLPDAKIAVERRYADKLPEIQADEQLCERIFVNLILNAFQAIAGEADGQRGTLRISIAPESPRGTAGVGISIEDTGPGVPPELREQIFNPFFTSKKEGVGLGLSIVAKIVDDHRGWIRLDSDSGGGARFHVFLPQNPQS
jgi:two-component system, NtrC family, sensor histidine kinase HydH